MSDLLICFLIWVDDVVSYACHSFKFFVVRDRFATKIAKLRGVFNVTTPVYNISDDDVRTPMLFMQDANLRRKSCISPEDRITLYSDSNKVFIDVIPMRTATGVIFNTVFEFISMKNLSSPATLLYRWVGIGEVTLYRLHERGTVRFFFELTESVVRRNKKKHVFEISFRLPSKKETSVTTGAGTIALIVPARKSILANAVKVQTNSKSS